MKKIIVIGCPGSGKSTFARSLHEKTGIPLCYLDMLYWNPDKTTVGRDVFRARLSEVLQKDNYIIDGNYQSTMEMRLEKCDTVFFLDYDLETCLSGVASRMGKPREDMPWVETEEDPEFMDFIKTYISNSRPQVLALLEKYKDKNIIVFKSREESTEYLQRL
jgi:adenylate kinase family enzyme